MKLLDVIHSRRSIRRFKNQPVPDDLVMKILEAGCAAPSACNRQLWEFVVVSKAEIKDRIADEACYKQPFIKQAPVLVVVFYDDTKERREEDAPRKHDAIQSAAAALENMFLAAHALGIGAVWICGIRRMLKLNAILEVPRTIRPIAIMAFGYPDETPAAPRRRPMDAFVHFERFHGLRSSYPNTLDPRAWSLEELAVFRGRICWFGGTFHGTNVLEKYAAGTFSYNALIRWAAGHIQPGARMMDFLPYGGGYLMGLLRNPVRPSELYAWELDPGNEAFIRQNLMLARLDLPRFRISSRPDPGQMPRDLDCITCFFRLEKVPDPKPWIRMMFDSLRPGGKLLLAFEAPNRMGFLRLFKGKKARNLHSSPQWNIGPSKPMEQRAVRAALVSSGFRITEKKRIFDKWIFKTAVKRIIRDEKPSILMVLQKPATLSGSGPG